MIVMGAGTNHWFHSDQTYRALLSLVLLCGCQGVNGGGWAHYVGQEKVRPLTGWQTSWPSRSTGRALRASSPATPFWYLMHTDQWRYETFGAAELTVPDGPRHARRHAHRRRAWPPAPGSAGCRCTPRFDRNPLDVADAARPRGARAERLRAARAARGAPSLRLRGPRRPRQLPAHPHPLAREPARLLEQGARVLPASHLLGVPDELRCAPPSRSPTSVRARSSGVSEAPEGKLDLLTTIDFRMTSTTCCLLRRGAARGHLVREARPERARTCTRSCIPSTQAIPPPWEARTDWDAFNAPSLSAFSELAEATSGTRARPRRRAAHRTTRPDEIAQPARPSCATGARVSASRSPARRCRSSWWSNATTRQSHRKDARRSARCWTARDGRQGDHLEARRTRSPELPASAKQRGVRRGPADGRPVAGATCHDAARRSSRCPAPPTATSRPWRPSRRWSKPPARRLLHDLAAERAGERITFADISGRCSRAR